jgi:preprotein translocase subunit SecE
MAKENAKTKKGGKKQNRVVKYFKDLKSEFKKVVWPSKQKVINNTTVVVVAMCVSGIVIWGIDSGLAALLKLGLGIGS